MSKINDTKWKISDILGFDLYNQTGERLGILSDVMPTGSNDIWVVKYDGEEILIPALKSVIKEVNLIRRKIFVNLPAGYEDIYGVVKSADGPIDYNGYIVYED